jgi:hypothetical protein
MVQRRPPQVCGDRKPTVADIKALRYTTRVIAESMRLYPQPPVLIRWVLGWRQVVGGWGGAVGVGGCRCRCARGLCVRMAPAH